MSEKAIVITNVINAISSVFFNVFMFVSNGLCPLIVYLVNYKPNLLDSLLYTLSATIKALLGTIPMTLIQ